MYNEYKIVRVHIDGRTELVCSGHSRDEAYDKCERLNMSSLVRTYHYEVR